ncbi:MAG: hypothetical protein HKO07_01870 [Pseudomonadales bacterium]|nr:hypothetical protein [Pseudomonadales bacterium]
MLCHHVKARPHSTYFLLLMLAKSCCPTLLLAHEYHYTKTGSADSTSDSDTLAIIQSQLAVELPATLQVDRYATLSWQHSYTQLQQAIAIPLHNGHLHNSRIRWQTKERGANVWRHDWTLGLAMSSNRFKNLQPDSDGLVLEGSTLKALPLSKNLSGVVGIQANYLFNRYRLLPDVGLQWQSPIGEVAVGTQRFTWMYDVSARQRISVIFARAASKWFVQDNDSGLESEVYLRKNVANISYQFNLSSAWAMRLGLGYTQVRRLDFQAASSGPIRIKFDGTPTFGLGLLKL